MGRQSGQSGRGFQKPGSVRPKPGKPADAQAKPTDAQVKPTDVLAKPADAQVKLPDAARYLSNECCSRKTQDRLAKLSHTTYFKFDYYT